MDCELEPPAVANGAEGAAVLDGQERLLFFASVLIGQKVEVQVSSGWVGGAGPALWPAEQEVITPGLCCCWRPADAFWRAPQTLDGVVYEGVFHCMKLAGGERHVVLRYAKIVRDPTITAEGLQELAQRPEETKVVMSAQLAAVVAKDVRMSAEDLGSEAYGDVGFETDAAISRGRGG